MHVAFVDGAFNEDFVIVQPPVAFQVFVPGLLYEMKEESGAAFFLLNVVSGTNTFGASVAFVTAGNGEVATKSLEVLIGAPLETMVIVGFGEE